MKIVHISTCDFGGAATSALRLHQGLLEQQIDSYFLCLYKKDDNQPNKIKYSVPPVKRTMYKRIKNRLGFRKRSQAEKNLDLIKDIKGRYEFYSFPCTDYRVEDHPVLKDADIVHLHWVADFINYSTFFSAVKKPIVWTLHDMNPFLGGFHYHEDAEKNKQQFEGLEKKLTDIKIKSVSNAKKIAVVTPSLWLKRVAEESKIFNNAFCRHILYSLDLKTYKINETSFARNVFNLPLNKKIILFVSASINSYRKGFDIVLEAINQLDRGQDFILVVVGEADTVLSKHENIFNIGLIEDERLMSLLFSSADLFILPSREDNLPNVMLESMACGTPVLSFKTGGMREVIKEGFNGFFASDMNAASLTDAIKRFCNGDYDFRREEIRQFAEDKFSLELQALQYKKLYREMLENTA